MSLNVSVVAPGSRGAAAKGLGRWLARIAPAKARGEVTVAIVPDAEMRALNTRYRRVRKTTDVLSFPADEGSGVRIRGHRPDTFLGEVVIAQGVAARQARALGHPLRTELRILALHGLLHLLGYDHDVDNGRMGRLEARLRRRAGLPEGLIARSS